MPAHTWKLGFAVGFGVGVATAKECRKAMLEVAAAVIGLQIIEMTTSILLR
jgi:hypothetical protein